MFEQVKEVLISTTNVDESKISLDASLKEDLGIDSLDSVEIILELESRFNVKIEDDEATNIKTVEDMVKILESKLQ